MSRRNRGDSNVRKHVTTACIPCRKTKVKCDGNVPTCRNCQSKGKDCSYRQRDDKRTIPLRIAVNLLAKRVGSLSRYIREHGLEVPSMSTEDEHNLNHILQALGFDHEEFRSGSDIANLAESPSVHPHHSLSPPEASTENHGNVINTGSPDFSSASNRNFTNSREPAVFPTNLDLGPTAESQYDAALIHHGSSIPLFVNTVQDTATPADIPPSQGVSQSDQCDLQQDNTDDLASADADEEFTNQLSWRLGRLQLTQDGQLRYFGPTSNLTLLDGMASVNFSSSINTQKDIREVLENVNLNIEVNEVLEQHLLELYFAWQNPSLQLVDYDLFWKARRQQPSHDGIVSSYCSQALIDAMCALGAAYVPKFHPELVIFPRSLSEFFGERARTLLDWEFEKPSLSTIQTLVILSNHEASGTRDTRGWLYSGMAMRLAFDLGLQLDMTPYVERGVISTEECKIRRTIFWAAYLNEQFWGYYLGRPIRSPISGVTVPKPDWDSSHSSGRWKPYDCIENEPASIYTPLEAICFLWVSLYDLMMPLTDVLYGCSEVSKPVLQELTATTVARLHEWKKNLPEGLDVDLSKECQQYLPHVLVLHMQYYQFMIHCHRPYISKHYIQPQPPQGPGSSHARMMCIESAVAIVRVLTMYERLYGFRKANMQMVSFTFSAALILIFTTVPSQLRVPDKEYTRYLGTCFWALDEMGCCFENAKRTSAFLATLQQRWHKCRRDVTGKAAKGALERHIQRNTDPTPSENRISIQECSGYDQFAMSRPAAPGPVNVDPPAGYWAQDYASTSEEALDVVDFIDPDLCNILLSEGIPRPLI